MSVTAAESCMLETLDTYACVRTLPIVPAWVANKAGNVVSLHGDAAIGEFGIATEREDRSVATSASWGYH